MNSSTKEGDLKDNHNLNNSKNNLTNSNSNLSNNKKILCRELSSWQKPFLDRQTDVNGGPHQEKFRQWLMKWNKKGS